MAAMRNHAAADTEAMREAATWRFMCAVWDEIKRQEATAQAQAARPTPAMMGKAKQARATRNRVLLRALALRKNRKTTRDAAALVIAGQLHVSRDRVRRMLSDWFPGEIWKDPEVPYIPD